jgi:hypothetical protein
MTALPPVLDRSPPADPAEDFYALRREGVGFIAKAGSATWTDYNVHDPGITVMEALCYAITDIAYRTGWDIADLLTGPSGPAPNQAFFTAREILTVAPTTMDDYRRMLIDLPGVRDAWLICKSCACEASWTAWCADDQLALGWQAPQNTIFTSGPKEVFASGLYDVLLELEEDPELGDLTGRLITYDSVLHDQAGAHPVTMELRFPEVELLEAEAWAAFLDGDVQSVALTRLGATKAFDVFTDIAAPSDQDRYIQNHCKDIFYLSFEVGLQGGGTLTIHNAALRVFGDGSVRAAATAADWKILFEDPSAGGFIQRYRKKEGAARDAVAGAKAALQAHRNLDEDWCSVAVVGVEEVAVCADIEVEPDADIERVQAEIWFRIERYFAPPVPFRTLRELMDAGEPVEEIFNGPALKNGFIRQGDLDAATLKGVLRVSDIIDLLMGEDGIEGIVAVNQVGLTKYDAEGQPVSGAADPTWGPADQPIFDPTKTGAAWLLYISPRHQPRLYLNRSRFRFYKNGLPFRPRLDEATDTLNQLRGDADRPKSPDAPKDLEVPRGTFRNPDDYTPVQYSLPMTYGVSPAGLPSHVSDHRRAQALDLKAYMMVYEQLIADALAQLAHTADLFSLDPTIDRTYFVKALGEDIIRGFSEIARPGLTPDAVRALIETTTQFQARRNLFLDHLLARFGEQFREYALLVTEATGAAVAQPRLIENKIAFLKRYPEISHDRFRARDYTTALDLRTNRPGMQTRIGLLLGFPDLRFEWTVEAPGSGTYPVSYSLADSTGRHLNEGQVSVAAGSAAEAVQAAYRTLVERMGEPDAWDIAAAGGRFRLTLKDAAAVEIGQGPSLFDSRGEAAALRDELVDWSANERVIVVEHLLLRPKFIGDGLYPACCDGGCDLCGCEDPYSFRLTVVMPGWTVQYTDDLDLRRFADRTIRQETPSHLVAKICWVGNDGFIEDLCDEVIGKVADLLIAEGKTAGGDTPIADQACATANAVYHAFSAAFADWFGDRKFSLLRADAMAAVVEAEFQSKPAAADIGGDVVLDAALWSKVRDLMVARLVDIALHGWQFARFEYAWRQWRDADAAIDWTRERLPERVEALLDAYLTSTAWPADICACAHEILTAWGSVFHDWMESQIVAGIAFEDLPAFPPPPVTLCQGMTFKAGAAEAIAALLADRYGAYRKASWWLRILNNRLAGLSNVYPGATLHDCDDGSDHNPVRLGSTALGHNPRRNTLMT